MSGCETAPDVLCNNIGTCTTSSANVSSCVCPAFDVLDERCRWEQWSTLFLICQVRASFEATVPSCRVHPSPRTDARSDLPLCLVSQVIMLTLHGAMLVVGVFRLATAVRAARSVKKRSPTSMAIVHVFSSAVGFLLLETLFYLDVDAHWGVYPRSITWFRMLLVRPASRWCVRTYTRGLCGVAANETVSH